MSRSALVSFRTSFAGINNMYPYVTPEFSQGFPDFKARMEMKLQIQLIL